MSSKERTAPGPLACEILGGRCRTICGIYGTPFGPSPKSLAAGAWLTPHASYGIGVTAPTAGCSEPSDAASCAPPQPQDPSGWVRDNGGRILLLVLPDGDVPVVLPVGVEACVQPQGADTCPH